MTHAQQTHSGTNTFGFAAVAAFAMATVLAAVILVNGLPLPSISTESTTTTADQALIEQGQAWELQREQQAGVGVLSPAVLDSARQWEEQSRAQSGASSSSDRAAAPTDPKIR